MAILEASTLIRLHALFVLLPLAYSYIFAPDFISTTTPVWAIGEALQLPDRTAEADGPSPIIFLVLVLAAATHIMLRPQSVKAPSKYNVFTFSAAHTGTAAWRALASALTGTFGLATLPIYGLSQLGVEGPLSVLVDRTLFTACFVEFVIWYYINGALKEDLVELSLVGHERGEEWGLSKVRID